MQTQGSLGHNRRNLIAPTEVLSETVLAHLINSEVLLILLPVRVLRVIVTMPLWEHGMKLLLALIGVAASRTVAEQHTYM